MNGTEIKNKIDENQAKIEKLINPVIFTLNKEVVVLMKENDELRAQCAHEYENGVCKYCYKEEER